MRTKISQSGAVSLFVVIFATLLMTVVTISFAQIMMRGQMQASVSDLSQSAYDSALAGVEDAKRAILKYQSICANDTSPGLTDCVDAKAKLTDQTKCNESVDMLDDVKLSKTTGEVKVQNSSADNSLNQAYTCVKVQIDTEDFVGRLSKDENGMVPLVGSNDFDTVIIEWFNNDDISPTFNKQVNLESITGIIPGLPSSWPSNRPSVIRAQIIQVGSSFNLNDFDNDSTATRANTLFIYPTSNLGPVYANGGTYEFAGRDIRRSAGNLNPSPARCRSNLSTGGYSCSAAIKLPSSVSAGQRSSFLRIGAINNKTTYRVLLASGTPASAANPYSNTVKFGAVQPSIDSTGRANDLFRRVNSRVELNAYFPYPNATIYTEGNLCKTFSVTDDVNEYSAGGCTP